MEFWVPELWLPDTRAVLHIPNMLHRAAHLQLISLSWWCCYSPVSLMAASMG